MILYFSIWTIRTSIANLFFGFEDSCNLECLRFICHAIYDNLFLFFYRLLIDTRNKSILWIIKKGFGGFRTWFFIFQLRSNSLESFDFRNVRLYFRPEDIRKILADIEANSSACKRSKCIFFPRRNRDTAESFIMSKWLHIGMFEEASEDIFHCYGVRLKLNMG